MMRGMKRQSGNRPRAGFTFVEILFAVMILGIGFIMVAAMFPVAIRQTQTNMEESAGAAVGSSAVKFLEQVNLQANQEAAGASQWLWMPPTDGASVPAGGPYPPGKLYSFRDSRLALDTRITAAVAPKITASEFMWQAVRGNLILNYDRRYAWIPFYKRNTGDAFLQVMIVVLQNRNRPAYDPAVDVFRGGTAATDAAAGSAAATLEPLLTAASFTNSVDATTGAPTTFVKFNTAVDAAKVSEGSYLIISDDQTPGFLGQANGYVYRIGIQGVDAQNWKLVPGSDMASSSYQPTAANVFIVGRGYSDPKATPIVYDGPSQDVAVYSSFIRLN